MNFYEYGMVKVAHSSSMAAATDRLLLNRMEQSIRDRASEALPVEARRDPRKQDAYYGLSGGPAAFPKGQGFDKGFGNGGGRANALLSGLKRGNSYVKPYLGSGSARVRANWPDPQAPAKSAFPLGSPVQGSKDAERFNPVDGSSVPAGGAQNASVPAPTPYYGNQRALDNSLPLGRNSSGAKVRPAARRPQAKSDDGSFGSEWRSMSGKQRQDLISRIKADQARAFGSMGPSRPARQWPVPSASPAKVQARPHAPAVRKPFRGGAGFPDDDFYGSGG